MHADDGDGAHCPFGSGAAAAMISTRSVMRVGRSDVVPKRLCASAIVRRQAMSCAVEERAAAVDLEIHEAREVDVAELHPLGTRRDVTGRRDAHHATTLDDHTPAREDAGPVEGMNTRGRVGRQLAGVARHGPDRTRQTGAAGRDVRDVQALRLRACAAAGRNGQSRAMGQHQRPHYVWIGVIGLAAVGLAALAWTLWTRSGAEEPAAPEPETVDLEPNSAHRGARSF